MSSGAGAGNAVLGWVSIAGSSTSMTGRSHPSSRSASPAVVIAAIGAASATMNSQPRRRHRRVDRQIGRPGLEHRQDRHDRLGGTGEQQRHTLSRARPVRGQQVRQPVRRLIEFAVGPRVLPRSEAPPPPQNAATCSANNTGIDTGTGRRLGQHRPVTHLIQPGVLTGIEHIHRRQPPPSDRRSSPPTPAATVPLNRRRQNSKMAAQRPPC